MSRLTTAVELLGAVANLAGALVYQRTGHTLADECTYLRQALHQEREICRQLVEERDSLRQQLADLQARPPDPPPRAKRWRWWPWS